MIKTLGNSFKMRFAASLVCSLFLFSIATLAGPPLVCHVFDIGNAKSLPLAGGGWNLSGKEAYNTRNLPADTIAILDSDSTVLVHMETLRRATLYARKDPTSAKELLTKLMARAESSGNTPTFALAVFDAGYLAETYKQWIGKDESNPALGVNGYRLVQKALGARGNDAQMEFAAALISLQTPGTEHALHAEKAVTGAKNDPLLARNLALRFHGEQGETMAELVSWNGQNVAAK